MRQELTLWLVLVVGLSGLSLLGVTANQSVKSTNTSLNSTNTAPNRWERTILPDPGPPPDSQTRATWEKRGAYFDGLIGSDMPLDQPQTGGRGYAVDIASTRPPLLVSSDAVVVARFVSFQPRLSATRRSVYTEITLNVEQVLKDLRWPIFAARRLQR